MVTLRRIVQALFLALFVALLVLAARPVPHLPVKGFLLTSPLIGLIALLSGTVAAWMLVGLAVLVLTAVFGRFFCGWVCPLGTTIDIGDTVLAWGVRRKRPVRGRRLRLIKYYVLIAVVILAALGSGVGGWLDPMSIATRTYTSVVYPVWSELVVRGAERLAPADPAAPWAETPVAWLERHRLVAPETFDVAGGSRRPSYRGAWVVAAMLVGIIGLGLYQRRFWCRNVCPLGALFALVGRLGLVRVRVGDRCTQCGRCERECKMGAFHERTDGVRQPVPSECILCWSCPTVCPAGAIRIGLGRGGRSERVPDTLPTRRGFLKAALGSLLAMPLLTVRFADRLRLRPRLRPPGALRPDDEFLARCIRCGECIKVCPQNALHPAMLEHGLEALMTPILVPRVGYCAYECSQDAALPANLCGHVCPTGAIGPLTHAEPGRPGHDRSKRAWRIGTAYFDRTTCIPWTHHTNCGVCEEHCPVPGKAIVFVEREVRVGPGRDDRVRVKLPHVIQERCIGCGTCEYVCPVRGEPGIRVHALQPEPAGDPRPLPRATTG